MPLGFDALHYWLQAQLGSTKRQSDSAAAETAAECVNRAALLVGPFGISSTEAALTAVVYLADLSTRYLLDRQAEAGARLGEPGKWLIPALAAGAARL
jgi:hypothetical protein